MVTAPPHRVTDHDRLVRPAVRRDKMPAQGFGVLHGFFQRPTCCAVGGLGEGEPAREKDGPQCTGPLPLELVRRAGRLIPVAVHHQAPVPSDGHFDAEGRTVDHPLFDFRVLGGGRDRGQAAQTNGEPRCPHQTILLWDTDHPLLIQCLSGAGRALCRMTMPPRWRDGPIVRRVRGTDKTEDR